MIQLFYSPNIQRFPVPHESEQQATIAKLAVEKYQRLTPLKHILYRPDSYIGSAFLSDEQVCIHHFPFTTDSFMKVY